MAKRLHWSYQSFPMPGFLDMVEYSGSRVLKGQAIRGFKGAVNNLDHAFGQWPKDYTLMCIGEFDDQHGTITMYQTMKPLGNGLSFLQNNENPESMYMLSIIGKRGVASRAKAWRLTVAVSAGSISSHMIGNNAITTNDRLSGR